MNWGPEQVARVRATADFVRVASELVEVRPATDGQRVGVCPFHSDQRGTLELHADDGHYRCSTCGAHGDLFALAQARRGLTYQQAVELVASLSGLDLVDLAAEKADPDLQHACRAACEFAAAHYEAALWSATGATALAYLRGRGITDDQIRQFRLGWAAGDLHTTALDRGMSAEVLRQADLTSLQEERLRDRFYHRVTVPILDHLGRVVAFSARLLPKDEAYRRDRGMAVAKYVNSTDTPVYHKGASLYSLRKARSASRKAKRLLLVEGPLDVIACAQAGYSEAVAAMGTAFTIDQARLLVDGADGAIPVVVALDGDKAGREKRATVVKHLLSVGGSVQVADLPDGDPADLLAGTQAGGTSPFATALGKSRPGMLWYLEHLAPEPASLDEGQRLGLLDQIMALVAGVADQSFRGICLKRAAKHLGLDQATAKAKQKAQAQRDDTGGKRLALTDYGNAQRFLALHRDDVRYCDQWSSWVVWTGARWEIDDIHDSRTWTLYHQALQRHLATEIEQAQRHGLTALVSRLRDWRESSDSTASHKSALEQACRLPELRARVTDFDRDPYLFCVANGTLDLRTGELLKHDRAHMITRIADAEWNGEVTDPRWDAFVAHLADKAEVADYLRRFAGYAATAITTEKAIVILQGNGDSGKTTFVKAIAEIFGGYAGTLNAENFLTQQQPQKKWELANCDSARFVTIEEVGTEGRGFQIDFLKAASGGNKMTGERKNQQPYSFQPVWKLLFVCNDTPTAPAGDDATWNRINLVHAAKPPKVLDKSLGEHFRSAAARSAILAWIVAGARDYLTRGGLDAPETVRNATKKHRDQCDYLMQYLDEVWSPGEPETDLVAVEVFLQDFHSWCKAHRHYELSAKSVIKRLEPLKVLRDQWVYSIDKARNVRAWAGIRRRRDSDEIWSQMLLRESTQIRHGLDTDVDTDSTQIANQASRSPFTSGLSGTTKLLAGTQPTSQPQQTYSGDDTDAASNGSVSTSVSNLCLRPNEDQQSTCDDLDTEHRSGPRVARTRENKNNQNNFFLQGEISPDLPIRVDGPTSPPGTSGPDLANLPPTTPPSRAERLRRPPGDASDEDPFTPAP